MTFFKEVMGHFHTLSNRKQNGSFFFYGDQREKVKVVSYPLTFYESKC